MTQHLAQVLWMPSPPLAPDDGPIDLAHLRRMTLGDVGLEQEVLAMFAAQTSELIELIVKRPPELTGLLHKLKGSAQSVGAFRVVEASEWLESALREQGESSEALMALTDAVLDARAEIDGLLKRS